MWQQLRPRKALRFRGSCGRPARSDERRQISLQIDGQNKRNHVPNHTKSLCPLLPRSRRRHCCILTLSGAGRSRPAPQWIWLSRWCIFPVAATRPPSLAHPSTALSPRPDAMAGGAASPRLSSPGPAVAERPSVPLPAAASVARPRGELSWRHCPKRVLSHGGSRRTPERRGKAAPSGVSPRSRSVAGPRAPRAGEKRAVDRAPRDGRGSHGGSWRGRPPCPTPGAAPAALGRLFTK